MYARLVCGSRGRGDIWVVVDTGGGGGSGGIAVVVPGSNHTAGTSSFPTCSSFDRTSACVVHHCLVVPFLFRFFQVLSTFVLLQSSAADFSAEANNGTS